MRDTANPVTAGSSKRDYFFFFAEAAAFFAGAFPAAFLAAGLAVFAFMSTFLLSPMMPCTEGP